MYIHLKDGFIEVSRWDGVAIADPDQDKIARELQTKCANVLIVQSRKPDPLVALRGLMSRIKPDVISTPRWEYPYRIYVGDNDFWLALGRIVASIDYQDFRAWMTENAERDDHKLAQDIWHAAFIWLAVGMR